MLENEVVTRLDKKDVPPGGPFYEYEISEAIEKWLQTIQNIINEIIPSAPPKKQPLPKIQVKPSEKIDSELIDNLFLSASEEIQGNIFEALRMTANTGEVSIEKAEKIIELLKSILKHEFEESMK